MQWRGLDISVFAIGDDSPLTTAEAAAVLSAEDHARAARFHFDADRDRWMRSRALLRISLAEKLGSSELAFCYGENGKPALAPISGGSQTPLHFNLSHSGDFAAIAAGDKTVGVDIEQWRNDLPVTELASYGFRTDESASLLESSQPLPLFYRLWTAKEAVMKCTGLGMSLPPASIIVRNSNGMAQRIDAGETFNIFAYSVTGAWTLSAATRQFPAAAAAR